METGYFDHVPLPLECVSSTKINSIWTRYQYTQSHSNLWQVRSMSCRPSKLLTCLRASVPSPVALSLNTISLSDIGYDRRMSRWSLKRVQDIWKTVLVQCVSIKMNINVPHSILMVSGTEDHCFAFIKIQRELILLKPSSQVTQIDVKLRFNFNWVKAVNYNGRVICI